MKPKPPANIDPIKKTYFFIGDDSVLIRQKITELGNAFLGEESSLEMAHEKIFLAPKDSKEEQAASLSSALESVRTAPAFSKKKIVQLECSQKDAVDSEIFRELCQAASRTTGANLLIVWICLAPEELRGFRFTPEELGMQLQSYAVEKLFQKESEKPLKLRIVEKIRKVGKRIQEKDLDEWLRCASGEEEVWGALEQILLGVGSNVEISRLQLEPHMNFERDTNAFALSNALGRRDISKALSLVHQAIEIEGEAPQMVLAKMTSFFTQLEVFSSLLARFPVEKRRFVKDRSGVYNFPDSFLAKFQSEAREGVEKALLKKHPYVLKIFFSAALDYAEAGSGDWLRELEELDERLKSSSLDPKILIEEALIRLLMGSKGSRQAEMFTTSIR